MRKRLPSFVHKRNQQNKRGSTLEDNPPSPSAFLMGKEDFNDKKQYTTRWRPACRKEKANLFFKNIHERMPIEQIFLLQADKPV